MLHPIRALCLLILTHHHRPHQRVAQRSHQHHQMLATQAHPRNHHFHPPGQKTQHPLSQNHQSRPATQVSHRHHRQRTNSRQRSRRQAKSLPLWPLLVILEDLTLFKDFKWHL